MTGRASRLQKSYGRLLAAILLVCLTVLLGACTAPQTRKLLANADPHSTQEVSLQIPFFPQTAYHCGPAALAGLMRHYGVDTSPDELASQVYLPGRKGSLQVEMTAAIRRNGLLAYPIEAGEKSEMEQLLIALDASFPVLVLQNLGVQWLPQWHYATVTGYNRNTADLLLNSGTQQNYRIPFSTFEYTWKRGDYWALVVVPPTTVPPFADAKTWNRVAFDLESTGQTAAALAAYRSSLRRWNDNEAALLGAGNTAFALEKAAAAADYFYRLASHSKDHAATGWNNLAYALKALSCPRAAAQAAAQAYQLAPEQTAVLNTFNEMTSEDNYSHSKTGPEKLEWCKKWREVIPDVIRESARGFRSGAAGYGRG